MDLKSAVQTVKPIETNAKWWKDNVREKMFSLNILENAVKEPGPIFRKKLPFLVGNWLKKSGFETRFQIRYALMEQIALLRSNEVLSTW